MQRRRRPQSLPVVTSIAVSVWVCTLLGTRLAATRHFVVTLPSACFFYDAHLLQHRLATFGHNKEPAKASAVSDPCAELSNAPETKGLRRRAFLAAALTAQIQAAGSAGFAMNTSPGNSVQASQLLEAIPEMKFGAPATNATVSAKVKHEIEMKALSLEQLGGRGLARESALNGSWRLLYSNAREITNLASDLPLGFALGPTYQPVDLSTGRFENQAVVVNTFGIARASTTVVGDVRPAPLQTVNAAGVVNEAGNRVDVDFGRIVFSVEELFGNPVSNLRKIVVPKQDPDAAQPANDITYLDQSLRITRGGDGGLFIFRREESTRPLLSLAERRSLYQEGGSDALTGKGVATDDAPPELRQLLKVKT